MSTAERRPLSTYLLAALLGLIGAVLGFILTGLVADTLLAMSGMPDREGYRAMIAFFTFAPFGGLVGLLGGIALVLRRRGRHRGLALAGRTALTAAALATAAGLSVWAYVVAEDDILAKNGPPPQLHFEIALPEDAKPPADGVAVDLNTDKNTMPSTFTMTTGGGRFVIKGQVDLYFRTARRILVLRMPGEPDRLFLLGLAANPAGTQDFSAWRRVDEIADGPDGALRKGKETDDYRLRYRVERSM
jgi:hypothetical protein